MRRALFVVALAVCALGATPAAAQRRPAQAAPSAEASSAETLAAAARAAYREGRYEEAAELYGRAHEIAGVGTLLYNQARALENATRLEEAVAAYERYLAADEAIDDRAGIEERVARLRARLDERRRLEEERARLEAELAARRPTGAEPVMAEPRAISPVPFVIGGAGVLGLGTGIALAVVAEDRHQAALAEPIQARADALQRERDDLALAANMTLAVSGVVTAVGAIWAIVELTAGDGPEQIAVRAGPGGIAVRGVF